MEFTRREIRSNLAVGKAPEQIEYKDACGFIIKVNRDGVQITGTSPMIVGQSDLQVFAKTLSNAYLDFQNYFKVPIAAPAI